MSVASISALALLGSAAGGVVAAPTPSPQNWNHGWDTTAAMTFADFNPSKILTDAEATFVTGAYQIISLEKCSGVGSGVKTEEYIYSTAKQLKAIRPDAKVLFYLATDQQGLGCYDAADEYAKHPEWVMKQDNGTNVKGNVLDCTNQAARDWWSAIPLGGVNGTGMFEGQPVSELIDGVLADSAGWSNLPGVSVARLEVFSDAKRTMVAQLQAKFHVANGGKVMANGISMYDGANEDPRYPASSALGHNLISLEVADAIMNEHTAVFECVNAANNSFNMATVSADLDAMIAASQYANGTKTVFMQTWPGLYARTSFYPSATGPASVYPPGGEATPQNNDEWRSALRRHFAFAHALFLSIAEPNIYWMYAGFWYSGNTGYITCPQDLESCPAPPEWYPDLKTPLGAPLGARQEISPYVWKREFEHASVYLDLYNPNASAVTFK